MKKETINEDTNKISLKCEDIIMKTIENNIIESEDIKNLLLVKTYIFNLNNLLDSISYHTRTV